jgi:hypothetical protein
MEPDEEERYLQSFGTAVDPAQEAEEDDHVFALMRDLRD